MNLSVQIFASLVLSVVVGLVLGDGAIGPVKAWIAPVGTMFINLIKMMIVPVVLCSLVVGMTSMGDLKKLGRIGMKTVGFYMVTTAIAIVIGFAVASVVQPGIGMALPGEAAPKVKEAPTIMQRGYPSCHYIFSFSWGRNYFRRRKPFQAADQSF